MLLVLDVYDFFVYFILKLFISLNLYYKSSFLIYIKIKKLLQDQVSYFIHSYYVLRNFQYHLIYKLNKIV